MARGLALITAVFPPSIGGIQSQTLSVARALAQRGNRVLVVTRALPGTPPLEWRDGVEIHRVGLAEGPGPLQTLAFVQAAVRRVGEQRARIDVLHCHQLLSPLTVGIACKALWPRVKLVLNPHACGDFGDLGRLRAQGPLGALRLLLARRTADACVAISDPIERELLEAGFARALLWRLGNGVDCAHFRPPTPEEKRALRQAHGLGADEEKVVLYAGRLAQEKGVDVLLRAVPTLLSHVPRARVVIVGDGPQRAQLQAQAGALGLWPGRVAFAGALADLAPLYRAADVAVLPSRTEGLPVSLLEAMASGLPCVATDVGGTPELLAGDVGRLVPSERPEALGLALAEVLQDRRLSEQFAQRARQRVLTHFSLEGVAERLSQLYDSLGGPFEGPFMRRRDDRYERACAGQSSSEDRVGDVLVPGEDGDVHPL